MRVVRKFGAIWGVGGIILLLLDAMFRLSPLAANAFRAPLGVTEWTVLVIWCVFMLYAEGYRGFQKRFSPRVVARAQYIAKEGSLRDIILAPLFCIGYFRAPMKRMIAMYSLTVGIIVLIIIIHQTAAQPWRGIIDMGVVLGLTYGLVWTCAYAVLAYKRRDYVSDPEVE